MFEEGEPRWWLVWPWVPATATAVCRSFVAAAGLAVLKLAGEDRESKGRDGGGWSCHCRESQQASPFCHQASSPPCSLPCQSLLHSLPATISATAVIPNHRYPCSAPCCHGCCCQGPILSLSSVVSLPFCHHHACQSWCCHGCYCYCRWCSAASPHRHEDYLAPCFVTFRRMCCSC